MEWDNIFLKTFDHQSGVVMSNGTREYILEALDHQLAVVVKWNLRIFFGNL